MGTYVSLYMEAAAVVAALLCGLLDLWVEKRFVWRSTETKIRVKVAAIYALAVGGLLGVIALTSR
jgi:hypothetical protein